MFLLLRRYRCPVAFLLAVPPFVGQHQGTLPPAAASFPPPDFFHRLLSLTEPLIPFFLDSFT